MDYFIKLIKKKYQVDVSKDARALQKLRREAERAKRALSSQHQVRVEIESLAEGVDLSEPLTRARFEELNMDLFKKTMAPVKKVCLSFEISCDLWGKRAVVCAAACIVFIHFSVVYSACILIEFSELNYEL
jgi:molecular chaperone DnaK (HSP70)